MEALWITLSVESVLIEKPADQTQAELKMSEEIILVGFVFAASFWIFQSILDVVLFYESDLIKQILSPDLRDVWIRTLVICSFIIFCVYARSVIMDYKRAEGKIQEQTKKIRESFLNSVTSLFYALEAKGRYTPW